MPGRVLFQRDDGRKEAGATTTHLPEGDNLYFTEERAQDAVAQMLAAGTHTGVSFDYDDAAGAMNVTAGGGGGFVPTYTDSTFTVPENTQALFVLPIELGPSGGLVVDGVLIEVSP